MSLVAVLFSMLFVYVTDNKPIPTDLRKEAISIHKTLHWDDEGSEGWCLTYIVQKNKEIPLFIVMLSLSYFVARVQQNKVAP